MTTWAWSHTAQAYADANANLADETPGRLIEMMTEWGVYQRSESEGISRWYVNPDEFDTERDKVRERYGKAHSIDPLIADIWDLAQAQATCDNNMKDAWMCPYGCHTVPFDRVTDIVDPSNGVVWSPDDEEE